MEAGSAHHMLSLPFLLMGRTPHSSPAPAWGPSHRRQSSMNLSNMSPSYRLQFFMNCPSVGPFHRVQSFRNRLLQHGLFSPWVHRSCQEPAPVQAFHKVTASFGCIHLLWHGVLHRLQEGICSTMDLRGLQWHSLPHHCLLHRLQGNLCSSAWSTSFLSFFMTLVSAGLFLSHVLTPPSCCKARPRQSWLALALWSTGEASSSFSLKPLL